ncbi:MAG: hypothetical protein IPK26_05780 [Planctomycetes bacterium]|nr:hypothetical protein [Planctomycetota bacterium]
MANGQADVAVGSLDGRDAAVRGRLQDLLLDNVADPGAGWQLCRQLGSPAVPLLRQMYSDQGPSLERRVTMLAAWFVACAPGDEERLLAGFEALEPKLEERVILGLLLALGPARGRRLPGFWTQLLGRHKQEPADILVIAANLAATRFLDPGTAPTVAEPDVGVLASMAFAGLPLPEVAVLPYWRASGSPPRYADLLWRGALLGRLREPQARLAEDRPLLERAQRLFDAAGEAAARTRAAAALLLGRAGVVRADSRPPGWDVVSWYAATPAGARNVQAWLQPVPAQLAEHPERLAVEYVMSRPLQTVVDDRAQWSAAPGIRRHVATALAFRLCGEAAPQPIEIEMPGVPEWFFVRWASGAKVKRDAAIDDPMLERLAALAEQDRLPRAVARTVLEEALWRWQSHPGWPLWQEQQALIRDLLLTGCVAGGMWRVHASIDAVYSPRGLKPESPMFGVAVRAFEFLSQPVPPIPPECRLQ